MMIRRSTLIVLALVLAGPDIGSQSARILTHAINQMPVIQGPVRITEESRFWQVDELRGKRIVGDLILERGVSNYVLRDVKIDRGSIIIGGNNWHGTFENIWIQYSPHPAGIIADDICAEWGADGVCRKPLSYNALTFRQVFVSHGAGFGWYLRSQTAINLQTCAADQNALGGFLFNGVHGVMQSCTAESNGGNALRWFDSDGVLVGFAHNNHRTHRVVFDGGSNITEIRTQHMR